MSKKWDKLNEELDNALNGMTDDEWIKFKRMTDEKRALSQDSVSVAFAKWIGEKRSKDDWFRYDDKIGKWYVYLKGHLSTEELFEMWLTNER